VQVGEARLAVAETGEGGRPLLGVHGFTGAKEDFSELAAPLAEQGWHVAVPDLRGHGDGEHLAGPDHYHPDAFVEDVLGVAGALGWDEFVLVGHSMGGALAQRIAIDHPGRVTALVLISTFHGPLDIDPALVALGQAIVASGGMEALAAALAARRANDPAALAARARIERVRPGYADHADRKLLRCSPAMWTAMAPRFPEWPDTLEEVRALAVPTLVVVGSEDSTMRPHCERLAAAVPSARLAVIDPAGHSPQIEQPARCIEEIVAFLEGPGGRPPGSTVGQTVRSSSEVGP
jgi:pimeloyl-ACP methyl ester carboxylesterase